MSAFPRRVVPIGAVIAAAWLVAGCGSSDRTAEGGVFPGQYVSVERPDRRVVLELRVDGSFVLELHEWDPERRGHVPGDAVSGTWKREGNDVVLRAGENRIVFAMGQVDVQIGDESAAIEGLYWAGSAEPTFADSCVLASRDEIRALRHPGGGQQATW